MNKENIYITISREYGSGGREIGKKLADRLGIPFYDKEIIEQTAFKTGFAEDYVKRLGEYASAKNWFEFAFTARNVFGMSSEDYLWSKQREVILDLASKGSCVIVGRCADFILREKKNLLNVFVHADLDMRMDRIVNVYKEPFEDSRKNLIEMDKKRSFNYTYYTEQEWGDSHNYHVCLDSSSLGIDDCVDILENMVKLKYSKEN